MNAELDFRDFMRQNGLGTRDPVIGDGKLHRFRVEGDKPDTRNGWYVLHSDPPVCGVCGSWKEGRKFQWLATDRATMPESARKAAENRWREAQRQRDTERQNEALQAQAKARELWARATPLEGAGHDYLQKKRVFSHGLRVDGSELLVPVQNSQGTLWSLQKIALDGTKRFLSGGKTSGHYFMLGTPDGTVYISEGYATGATVYELMRTAVACAFHAGNLKSVATTLRQKYPTIKLIIAGDNDRQTAGNPGRTKAEEAARVTGAAVLIPEFTDPDGKGTDFNDLATTEGPDVARRQLTPPAESATTDKRDPVEAAQKGSPYASSDLGNAERLAYRIQDLARFDPAAGAWRVWYGGRWAVDETGILQRAAARVARGIFQEAMALPQGQNEAEQARFQALRKELFSWAIRSEAKEKLSAMVDLARHMDGITLPAGQWDRDPWLFCCRNGTLDLRTGELHEHRPADYITRQSPVEFDPDTDTSSLADFLLQTAGGDSALAEFLQRAVGYTLTGDTSEEKLFFLFGPEATGKSTFIEAVKAMLGEYSATADFETFLRKPPTHKGHSEDLARLAGKRLVVSVEVQDGQALAEGVVKVLTGGDTISASFKYGHGFEFMPTFKLFLAANHSPKVDADDGAMWRRILRIPFKSQVPKEKRDPRVKMRLRDPKAGGREILAWAVRGCLAWQEHGLGVPEAVELETAAYRQESDPLRGFFEDVVEVHPALWIESKALRAAYVEFADAEGIPERFRLSERGLGERLRAKGCESSTRHNVRGWRGIALRDDTEPIRQAESPQTLHHATPSYGTSDKIPYEAGLEKVSQSGVACRSVPSLSEGKPDTGETDKQPVLDLESGKTPARNTPKLATGEALSPVTTEEGEI